MSPVPLDIERDILAIVPIKSLARFRFASKSWQKKIDEIISEQSSLGINNRILSWPYWRDEIVQLIDYETLIKTRDTVRATTKVKVSEIFNERDSTELSIQPLGSCNGLICLDILQKNSNGIVLWNPLTRVYKKIASLGKSSWDKTYHPYFGYEVSSGDYKVVLLVEFYSFSQNWLCKVYSVKNNIWTSHELPGRNIYRYFLLETIAQTSLNGSLHWIIRKKFHGVEAEGRPLYATVILAFDLAKEIFSEIQLPECLAKVNGLLSCFPYLFLTIFDGQLCLLYDRDDEDGIGNDDKELWVMKEHGVKKSWVPLFSVSTADVRNFRPLCMSQEKQIVALVDERKLVTYDPIKRKVWKMKPRERVGAFGIVYGQSLISPNMLDQNLVARS